jgi:hypothetical protein
LFILIDAAVSDPRRNDRPTQDRDLGYLSEWVTSGRRLAPFHRRFWTGLQCWHASGDHSRFRSVASNTLVMASIAGAMLGTRSNSAGTAASFIIRTHSAHSDATIARALGPHLAAYTTRVAASAVWRPFARVRALQRDLDLAWPYPLLILHRHFFRDGRFSTTAVQFWARRSSAQISRAHCDCDE